MQGEAATVFRNCGKQYSGAPLVYFSVSHIRSYDLRNLTANNSLIQLIYWMRRNACTTPFVSRFPKQKALFGPKSFLNTVQVSRRGATAQRLTFGFASLIFCDQVLQWSELYKKFFHQSHRVHFLKAFVVVVALQWGFSSKGDIEDRPPLRCPSPAGAFLCWMYLQTLQCLGTLMGWCGNVFLHSVCWKCGSQIYRLFSRHEM